MCGKEAADFWKIDTASESLAGREVEEGMGGERGGTKSCWDGAKRGEEEEEDRFFGRKGAP